MSFFYELETEAGIERFLYHKFPAAALGVFNCLKFLTRRASANAKRDVMKEFGGAGSRFEGFGVLSAFRGPGGWQSFVKIDVMDAFVSFPDGRF